MINMTSKKTLRDILLPGKIHKNKEESNKINYAMKTIVRIIIFYLIKSIILIKIRDLQFMRNISEIEKKSTVTSDTIEILRNKMMLENLIIIIVMSVLSLAILFYCNKRMNETG